MTGLEHLGIHFFLHPAIGFLALALVLAFLKTSHYLRWRWLLLVPPVMAIVAVVALTISNSGPRDLATIS